MGDGERLSVLHEEGEDAAERGISPLEFDDAKFAPPPRKAAIHLAFYIALWIGLSSATILFNKYILTTAGFNYPILLTSWHMAFSSIMTQILARTTNLLDSRETVGMTQHMYSRTILPIAVLFSLCLITGNVAYVYLTVSFIQMLKAAMPVVTIIVSWGLGLTPFSLSTFGNASFIVFGVVIASYGEVQFVLIGVLIQLSSVVFDAIRLVLMQHVLTTAMDSLVLLYYYSPLCCVLNLTLAVFIEVPRLTIADVTSVGVTTLIANASVAFGLNIATVLLISKTTSLSMTLCGVLKNILIVLASMLVFRDAVSSLQAIGYSIAMCGLVYYQLGGEKNVQKIREVLDQSSRAWEDLGQRSPMRYWLAITGCVLLALASLVGILTLTRSLDTSYQSAKLAIMKIFGTLRHEQMDIYTDLHVLIPLTHERRGAY